MEFKIKNIENAMYKPEQLKAIYQALKGINAVGDAAEAVGLNRIKFKEQFYPTIETKKNALVHNVAIKFLKNNGVLQDIQLLIEILN
jgi:hypothetical protein